MTEKCARGKKYEPSVCWPDDPDYLDGKTEIELPSERSPRCSGTPTLSISTTGTSTTIIGTEEVFLVRFRVELRGRLWKCMTGDWLFDVGFKPIGPGHGFYLAALLPGDPNLGLSGLERL